MKTLKELIPIILNTANKMISENLCLCNLIEYAYITKQITPKEAKFLNETINSFIPLEEMDYIINENDVFLLQKFLESFT